MYMVSYMISYTYDFISEMCAMILHMISYYEILYYEIKFQHHTMKSSSNKDNQPPFLPFEWTGAILAINRAFPATPRSSLP